jgi:hypothetical protein
VPQKQARRMCLVARRQRGLTHQLTHPHTHSHPHPHTSSREPACVLARRPSASNVLHHVSVQVHSPAHAARPRTHVRHLAASRVAAWLEVCGDRRGNVGEQGSSDAARRRHAHKGSGEWRKGQGGEATRRGLGDHLPTDELAHTRTHAHTHTQMSLNSS